MDHLQTEARNPASNDLDRRSALELVRLMNGEDARVLPAVAHERIPGAGAARIATVFLDLLDAAEQAPRLQPRVFMRQAARLQAFGLAFEMELQLFAQIGFAAAAEQEGSKPAAKDVPGTHGYVLSRTRLTPAESRSHFATSVSTCLCPDLVSAYKRARRLFSDAPHSAVIHP